MASLKYGSMRWWLLLLCLFLGTWFGIFMQGFGSAAPFFRNVVDFAVDLKRLDLVMCSVGFYFSLKLNLGTLLGCIVGIWLSR